MVSQLSATDIPRDRVDALHILALNGDDLDRLKPDQLEALRRLYRLDDPRSIRELIESGDLR
jgi:hypothetical protein